MNFGARFLIVEPGAFRTGLFAAGSAYLSTTMPEYDVTVGPTRRYVTSGDGMQVGDPAKAAAAILTALAAEHPPLRLALGSDAVDGIRAHLGAVGDELTGWEAVSRATSSQGWISANQLTAALGLLLDVLVSGSHQR